jgi:copper chaperone
MTRTMALMNRVLLGVRGLPDETAANRVMETLKAVKGVSSVTHPHPGQLEISYDPAAATVMDLIRAVRSQGFLAGML